jgi:hypothetical protein
MEPETSFGGVPEAGEGLVFAHPMIAGQKWLGAGVSGCDEQSVPPLGARSLRWPGKWAHGRRSTIEPPQFLTEHDSAGGTLLGRVVGRMVGRTPC